MSNKGRPQYSDPKGVIQQGFDGNAIECEGSVVPANGQGGFAPGCVFYKRGAAGGVARYYNLGTALSCQFSLSSSGVLGATGVAVVTGTLDVPTGLATVTSALATLQDDASLNGTIVTATVGNQAGAPAAGSIRLKVWKPTGAGDCTPIAAVLAKSVNWAATGV